MKKITLMAFLICTAFISYHAGAQEVNKNYDEKLAKELKADDYGMKKYIFIFDAETTEEVQKLVETDPVIISKVMTAEYYPWYGSAALKETVKIHSKIEKKSH